MTRPTTTIPVWDTAWNMFAKGTAGPVEKYAATLYRLGFAGAWSFPFMHPDAHIWSSSPGSAGTNGFIDRGGNVRFHDDYAAHCLAFHRFCHDTCFNINNT